jgi:hypothetical protein
MYTMTHILLILILSVAVISSNAQGTGIGYMIDIGGSSFSQISPEYNQGIGSITQNGFVRFHDASGHNALQLMVGYKKEHTFFQNYSDFLSSDGTEMLQYNTDAQIRREAWKICIIDQWQFGRQPGKLMYSLNTGLFYEQTRNATRNDINGDWTYDLQEEIRPANLGCILGAEVRFDWFTIGYKMEKLFWDILDHDYIIGEELNFSNSSELRGLKLNPWMHYLCLGVNLDFFKDKD